MSLLAALLARLAAVRGRRGLLRLLAWAVVTGGVGGAVHVAFARAAAAADARARRRRALRPVPAAATAGDTAVHSPIAADTAMHSPISAAAAPPPAPALAASTVPDVVVYIATLLHLLGAGIVAGVSVGGLFVPGHRGATAAVRRAALCWMLASGGVVYLTKVARIRARGVPGAAAAAAAAACRTLWAASRACMHCVCRVRVANRPPRPFTDWDVDCPPVTIARYAHVAAAAGVAALELLPDDDAGAAVKGSLLAISAAYAAARGARCACALPGWAAVRQMRAARMRHVTECRYATGRFLADVDEQAWHALYTRTSARRGGHP